jgi:hypothetical protein
VKDPWVLGCCCKLGVAHWSSYRSVFAGVVALVAFAGVSWPNFGVGIGFGFVQMCC